MTRVTVTLCFFLLALGATAQTPSDPFAGRWVLDLDRWAFDLDSQPKHQTLRVEMTPNSASILIEGMDSRNKAIHIERELQFDGGQRPSTEGGNAWDSVADRRIDSHTIESVYRNKGKIVRTVRYTVAKDGKTLTVATSGTNPKGVPFNFADVYQRPKPGRLGRLQPSALSVQLPSGPRSSMPVVRWANSSESLGLINFGFRQQ